MPSLLLPTSLVSSLQEQVPGSTSTLEKSHRVQVPQAQTATLEKAWKVPSRDWTRTNTLMTHEGQEMGSAGDTKLSQLSMSSYNGSLGEQQTLLRPEGGKGRGKKKIHPRLG